MALLKPHELENLSAQLEENNVIVKKATGYDIKEICEGLYGTRPNKQKVGVIPISSGEGIIGNFSSSLQFIAQHFGFDSFITQHSDITGYYEAVSQGADIILMADDHMFVAHNLRSNKIVANHIATGVIYAEIASRSKEASSKDILVIGLGRVGYAGATHLVKKGFNVYACDPNKAFLEKAVQELGIKPYCKDDRKRFSMVFEATPNPDTITEGMIEERCLVSTPGLPCGLPPEIGKKYRVDLVMEPLVIGVASMLYSVI